MTVLRSHTRHAGLLASLIALPLLVMPQPTHADGRPIPASTPNLPALDTRINGQTSNTH
jgi:hypothetical protein